MTNTLTTRTVTITTFGYRHGSAPAADVTFDLRRWLHDPAFARELLDLDGRDPRVQYAVATTPGAPAAINHLVGLIVDYPTDRPCVIAVGCSGGRHRSVAVAIFTAFLLMLLGIKVVINHLHVHLPRVLSSAPARKP